MKNEKGKGDRDLESENVDDYLIGCRVEIELILDFGFVGSV